MKKSDLLERINRLSKRLEKLASSVCLRFETLNNTLDDWKVKIIDTNKKIDWLTDSIVNLELSMKHIQNDTPVVYARLDQYGSVSSDLSTQVLKLEIVLINLTACQKVQKDSTRIFNANIKKCNTVIKSVRKLSKDIQKIDDVVEQHERDIEQLHAEK